ncbi:MAG: ADP-ribosylglycohydrolase family protein [Verrucomicrobia bacterium]|nr:ADP-ribosylglycohydrolase family protein [Verrucomicrobiota bacterium]
MDDNISRAERIRGGLLGALVGDALGVPVEFRGREVRALDPVTGPRGYGTWNQPPGTWSDDGALLLCTADALAAGDDLAGLADRFVRWQREGLWTARGEVFDIGNTTAAALWRLERGVPPLEAGLREGTSNGNGSLMRILPVAWHYADRGPEAIVAEARRQSCLTHAHLRSQLCCAFYCLLAAELLAGAAPAAAFAAAQVRLAPLIEEDEEERRAFGRLLRPDFADLPRDEIWGTGYVLHCLEAACWCLLQGGDFASMVLAAINLGDDTDTTGCVTGGLAGLHFGFRGLPDAWLATLPRRADLDSLLARIVGEG